MNIQIISTLNKQTQGLFVAGARGCGHDLSPWQGLRGQEEGGHQATEGRDGHGQGLLEIKTRIILDRVSQSVSLLKFEMCSS